MLLERLQSLLLVVDIQEKLLPHVMGPHHLLSQASWCINVAKTLNVPIAITEQYPKGLGHTEASLQGLLPEVRALPKIHFSCAACPDSLNAIQEFKRQQVILIGMETHVCIMQTAFDCVKQGFEVFVIADCVSARHQHDHDCALARMRAHGIHIITKEMMVFEWLRQAGTDEFKQISKQFLR